MSESLIESTNDVVVFENVADQYVKGEDVHIQFTILNNSEIHPDDDRIGLIRVGASNVKDCLIQVPITLNTSNSSTTAHHGEATIPSSSLNMSDDEFYQFCYLNHQGKFLALSIPFQLNCSSDDIVLLTSVIGENPRQSLISLSDGDHEDLVVIHTKGMLLEEKLRQENRQLLEKNRRLEGEQERLEMKLNEYLTKTKNDLQILAEKHQKTIDELNSRQRIESKLRAEYETSIDLCQQYQNESLQFAERCRDLEETHSHLKSEHQRLRTQLNSSNQLVDEQTIQIVELEKSLIKSNEALKKAHQQQNQLEQQIRDLRLSTEKYQSKLDAFVHQALQHENQIHALESANNLLKNELKTVNDDKTFLLTMMEEDKFQAKHFQDEIQKLQKEKDESQKQMENLRREFEENRPLMSAMNEIQKRCVKHQKGEIDAKKELTTEKQLVIDLKRKVEELTERLTIGGDEYKALYRKYVSLQQSVGKNSKTLSKQNSTTTSLSNETGLNEEALVSLLRNSYELQQQQQQQQVAATTVESKLNEEDKKKEKKTDDEQGIRECPMCYWEFPNHLTLDSKKQHIDAHFD